MHFLSALHLSIWQSGQAYKKFCSSHLIINPASSLLLFNLEKRRVLVLTHRPHFRETPRVERASAGRVNWAGHPSGQNNPLLARFDIHARYGSQQRLRRGVVWLNTLCQGILGVGVFLARPSAVFADVGGDPLAMLCLRLVAYGNLAQGIVAVHLLRRDGSTGAIRALAGAGAVFHLLSGIESIRLRCQAQSRGGTWETPSACSSSSSTSGAAEPSSPSQPRPRDSA